MTARSLTLVSMLIALGIVGYLFAVQARDAGPTSKSGQQLQQEATDLAATANFQSAAPTLQAYFIQNGTYAGATLPPVYGVTLAHADATSYCLQAGSGATAQHVTGPGGSPTPGAC